MGNSAETLTVVIIVVTDGYKMPSWGCPGDEGLHDATRLMMADPRRLFRSVGCMGREPNGEDSLGNQTNPAKENVGWVVQMMRPRDQEEYSP